MATTLHDQIIYGHDISIINSPAFYDCVIHLLCLKGNAFIKYNHNQFEIRKNDVAVITSPRDVTAIVQDTDFKCDYIVAPEDYLHSLLPANNYSITGRVSLFSDPIMNVSEVDASKFRDDLTNIASRCNDSQHLFFKEMMGGLIRTMIYDLFDFHARLKPNILTTDRVSYVTRRFFTLIEEGYPKIHREPSFYADHINVTVKYLSETIKRVSGKSVSSHINREALSILITYLNDSNLSLTQIADEMRFYSLSHFSHFCKKHLGMSPSEYRTVNTHVL